MSKILTLHRNIIGTDYFIGDIHGCYSLVEEALKAVGFDKRIDRLICLGDLTDRGPESSLAPYYLSQPWFISVQGNHDAFVHHTAKLLLEGDKKVLNYSADARTCFNNGGMWLLNESSESLEAIAGAFAKLPIAIEYQDEDGRVLAGLIHAEVDYHDTWSQLKAELETLPADYVYSLDEDESHSLSAAVWGRSKARLVDYKDHHEQTKTEGAPIIICGHNIMPVKQKGPVKISNNRFIDHGICKTGLVLLYTFGELAA